jgi:hypothetical protein
MRDDDDPREGHHVVGSTARVRHRLRQRTWNQRGHRGLSVDAGEGSYQAAICEFEFEQAAGAYR